MAGRTITVDFIGHDRSLSRTARMATSATSRLGSTLAKVGRLAALGLAVGAAIAAKGLYDATKAAIEDQAAQEKLAAALKNNADATNQQVAATERWITAQGKAFGFTDDELRPALGRLITATHDVGEAQRLAALAMDVSAGSGKSLETVSTALMKAQNGQVSSLSRLGINVKNAKGETVSFEEATRRMAETFGGQASKHAQTLEGKLSRLKVMFDESKEALGERLIPVVTNFADWMFASGIPMFKQWGENLQRVGEWIGANVIPRVQALAEYLATKLAPVVAAIGAWITGTAIPALREFGDWLGVKLPPLIARVKEVLDDVFSSETGGKVTDTLADIQTIIVAFVGYAQDIWDRWGTQIKAVAGAAFKLAKAQIVGSLTVIQGIIKVFAGVLTGDWGKAWEGVKKIASGAFMQIKAIFTNGGTVLKAAAQVAWDLIKQAFNAGVDKAVAAAKRLPSLAAASIRGGLALMVGVGKDIIGGVISGIKAMAGSLIGAIKTYVTDALPGFVKKALGIASPSKVFAELGGWTIQGFANGIIAAAPGAVDAVSDMVTKVQQAVLDRLTTMRDKAASVLSDLRSDFMSLRDSVASNFTSDLFGAENVHDFMVNLVNTKGMLQNLKKAFQKLVRWGVSPQFLSALFSNGGGGLILELAAGNRITALTAGSVFGEVGQLGNQLGSQVASADIGPALRTQTHELREIKAAIRRLPDDFAKAVNGAVSHGNRRGA